MSSAEQLALWAAIRANPLDDTPRLVYADWLQENGDEPRAELVRLQCSIAKLPDDRKGRKARPAMEHRERVLLTANRGRWMKPFVSRLCRHPHLAGGREEGFQPGEFYRGFLSQSTLDLDVAFRLVTSSPPLEPMSAVLLLASHLNVGDARKIEAVTGWDDAGCFQTFGCYPANDEHVWLVVNGRLTGLRSLALASGSVTDAGASQVAAWPGAERLSLLSLHSNRIGDVGAAALADSPYLSAIDRLDLRRNPISAAGQRRLTARFGAAVLLPDD